MNNNPYILSTLILLGMCLSIEYRLREIIENSHFIHFHKYS